MHYELNIRKYIGIALSFLTIGTSATMLSGCAEQGSNLVEFVEDNNLNTPNDTVSSLLGIVNKLQTIADRTIILGELRGDLTSVTENASLNLQNIANFEKLDDNPYNQISDYYAVIQNCNYFLAKADTTLKKQGRKVFEREYAAVKAYRAWTYLQLAINYGSVPFFTQPILTEKDAEISRYPKYDVEQIADYFITDLAPYVDTEYPQYGTINGFNTSEFYIPVRVLLGDLCLWAGRYKESAQYYHDFLTKTGDYYPVQSYTVAWDDNTFEKKSDSYTTSLTLNTECLCYIPMESDEYEGLVSDLDNVFCSTDDNNYFYQATHSAAHDNLSRSQKYVLVYADPVTLLPDTILNSSQYADVLNEGDLRLLSTYTMRSKASSSSTINNVRLTNYKHISTDVVIYRLMYVYLRYAEALNRAGYPNAAFAVLKYGLWKDNIEKYIPADERESAGDLLSFSEYQFTRYNTIGIHSRGCGNAEANPYYVIPECSSKSDSIMAVEDLICDEMALETASEGVRYYDLMRIAMHRSDPTFLAAKVANRDGKLNSALYAKLSDKSNWYLPIK